MIDGEVASSSQPKLKTSSLSSAEYNSSPEQKASLSSDNNPPSFAVCMEPSQQPTSLASIVERLKHNKNNATKISGNNKSLKLSSDTAPNEITKSNLNSTPSTLQSTTPVRSPGTASRWSKLRTTMSMTSAMAAQTKQKRLERQDSFIKKFTTQRGGEASDDEDGVERPPQATVKSSTICVVDPQGTVMMAWMGVVTLAVIYNLWTCIAREAFVEIRAGYDAAWFSFDGICDLIYILDIAVQVRTTYLERGLTVRDKKKLAMNYIRSKYFIADIASLLPLDLFQLIFGIHPMIRFPRFIKVHRAWRWKTIVENRTVFPNAWRVANLTHLLFLGCHWFAAFYFLISKAENFESSWGYPKPVGEFASVTRMYLKSLYWSTLTLTTIGDLPAPILNWEKGKRASRHEDVSNLWYIFTIASYFIGVFIFATIVGQVGNVITNRNATRLEFEKILDNAKNFMTRQNVPKDLQKRVMRWYDYAWTRGHANGAGDLNALALLPDKLKTELALHVNLETLRKVTIFQECRPEFLHDLVLKMRPYIFTPKDLICRKGEVAREMFIIADGLLEVISDSGEVLKQMGSGDFFGEIGILNLDGGVNRRTADVVSIGYSELFVLSKEDVLSALQDHPDAEALIVEYGRRRLKEIKDRREKRPRQNHNAGLKQAAPFELLPGIAIAPKASLTTCPERRLSTSTEPLKSLFGRLKRSFSRLKELPPSPPTMKRSLAAEGRNSIQKKDIEMMPASKTCEFFIEDGDGNTPVHRSSHPGNLEQTQPLLKYAEEHIVDAPMYTLEQDDQQAMVIHLSPSPSDPTDGFGSNYQARQYQLLSDTVEVCPPVTSATPQIVRSCYPTLRSSPSLQPTLLCSDRLKTDISPTPMSALLTPLSNFGASRLSLNPSTSNIPFRLDSTRQIPGSQQQQQQPNRRKMHSFDGYLWAASQGIVSADNSPASNESEREFNVRRRSSAFGGGNHPDGVVNILRCVDELVQTKVREVEDYYLTQLKSVEESLQKKDERISELETELLSLKDMSHWRSTSAPSVARINNHFCECGIDDDHFSCRL